ncbi:9703_t:CDS:1 [Gigaspora rosea]|nr:9703_t:CDS:1 [Gigaspora rosea]
MLLEDLNNCICVNRIWYKEICRELYKRHKNFNTKYYNLLEKLDRCHRKSDINDNEIEPIYNNALTIFDELVKVERYLLNNNMIFSKRIRNAILSNIEDYNYGNPLDSYNFGEDTFEYIKYLM